jgi:hypothetical protein
MPSVMFQTSLVETPERKKLLPRGLVTRQLRTTYPRVSIVITLTLRRRSGRRTPEPPFGRMWISSSESIAEMHATLRERVPGASRYEW